MHTTFIINGLTRQPGVPLVSVVAYGYDSMGDPTGDHIRLSLSVREADRLSIGDAVEVDFSLRLKAPFIDGFGVPDVSVPGGLAFDEDFVHHPDSEMFLPEAPDPVAVSAAITELVRQEEFDAAGEEERVRRMLAAQAGLVDDKLTDYGFLAP